MKKILVIDDEENILQLYSDELQEAGYRVMTARNGSEALELLQTLPEHDATENAERLVTLLRTGELPPSRLEEALADLFDALEAADEALEVPDLGLPEVEPEQP